MELYSVLCANLNGREVWGRMDTCICMYGWVPFCSPETTTTWLIGYTLRQNKSLKFERKIFFASLVAVWFYLFVLLICISLIASEVKHHFRCSFTGHLDYETDTLPTLQRGQILHWPFRFLLLWSLCSDLWSIFLSDYLSHILRFVVLHIHYVWVLYWL